MKKFLTLLLTLFLILSLASCEDIIDTLLEEDETEEPASDDETADVDTADDEASDAAAANPATNLATSTVRNNIITLARKQIGILYYYGGSSPTTGFDCSGFSYYCYGQYGITLPRTSRDQYARGTNVGLSRAKFGDIIAFYSPVSHVGMITSSTTFIHSPSTGRTVEEESLEGYWTEKLTGVVSYINQ